MSRLQKGYIFDVLTVVGPPETHPAYEAWSLWRAAVTEMFDPRIPIQEPRYLAVVFHHQYLDALKAAGDFDVKTIDFVKARYKRRMVRALQAARKPFRGSPRPTRVAARRWWLAQSAGRGARAPDGDGSGSDPAWLSGAHRRAAERVEHLRVAVPSDVLKTHRRRIDQAIAKLAAYCALECLPWEPTALAMLRGTD